MVLSLPSAHVRAALTYFCRLRLFVGLPKFQHPACNFSYLYYLGVPYYSIIYSKTLFYSTHSSVDENIQQAETTLLGTCRLSLCEAMALKRAQCALHEATDRELRALQSKNYNSP